MGSGACYNNQPHFHVIAYIGGRACFQLNLITQGLGIAAVF